MVELKKSLIKNIPTKTGIYLMKNAVGKTIYIGKAKNIKSRVGSYFNVGDNNPRLVSLLNELEFIDFIVTKDEREALILENSLIKTHRPKYNIRLKDDKSYSFLALTLKDNFPRFVAMRRVRDDGSLYYGPFASSGALKQTKRQVSKLFGIRDCSDKKFSRHRQRPCLNYDLRLCLGPCAKKVDRETYMGSVDRVRIMLNRGRKDLVRVLKKEMNRSAREERFDDAIRLRDQVKTLEKDTEVSKVLSSDFDDRDVLCVQKRPDGYEVVVLFYRSGSITDRAEYSFDNFHRDENELAQQFMSRFYHSGRYIPKEILINVKINALDIYKKWLCEKKGKQVTVIIPKQGARSKLLELAKRNADESYKRRHAILEGLKNSLSLKKLPKTIECFDVSNIQGKSVVASLVRFSVGKPDKSRYRRYKVTSISSPDDFKSLSQVLTRRFARKNQNNWELPDLIIIDGGKGQLSTAAKVMKLMNLDHVDLISIAKDKSNKDNANSVEFVSQGRESRRQDKVYVIGEKTARDLGDNREVLYYLMRIRDEAHRVAVSYHRRDRSKELFASGLDGVPGVGKKRKMTLLSHFGSMSKVKKAPVEVLSTLPGITRKVALEIKRHL